jgi:hypothetical protein
MFAVLHTVKPSSNEDLLNVDSIERVEIDANYYLPERGKLDYARNAEEGLVGGEEFNDFLKS